jgi:hypothetical protein
MFIDSATAHSAAFAELVRYLARDVAAAATASTRKSADLADAFAAVLSGADAAAGAMSARALRYAERIRRVLNNDSFAKFSAFVADHKARLGLMLAPAIATAARSAHDATALASTFAASASVRADDWAGQVRAFASSSGRRVADVIHGCKPLYVRALHVSAAGYDVFVAFAALAKNDVSTVSASISYYSRFTRCLPLFPYRPSRSRHKQSFVYDGWEVVNIADVLPSHFYSVFAPRAAMTSAIGYTVVPFSSSSTTSLFSAFSSPTSSSSFRAPSTSRSRAKDANGPKGRGRR